MSDSTPAAKKAAAKKSTNRTTSSSSTSSTNSNAQGEPNPQSSTAPVAGANDSGPGTASPLPPEEGTVRSAQATQVALSGAAPVESPDVTGATEPEHGHAESSTDHVYSSTGGRTIAGEEPQRLVDDDGKKVKATGLFEDADGKSFRVVKQNVNEVFVYPNTTEECERRLLTKGQRVSLEQATQIEERVKTHAS